MTVSPGTIVTDLERTLQPDVTPNPPAAPAAPLLPNMSVAEAESRRQEMLNDPSWWQRWNRGDIDANHEFKAVTQVIADANRPREPSAPGSPEGLTDWALSIAPGLTEAHLDELRNPQPISPELRRQAVQWKRDHIGDLEHPGDPEFVRAYLSGNSAAQKQVLQVNTLLALPVRDPQQT